MIKGLDKMLGSPFVKKLLLKQITELVKDNKITLITITPDEKGELKFEAYTDNMIVVRKEDMNILIEKISNL